MPEAEPFFLEITTAFGAAAIVYQDGPFFLRRVLLPRPQHNDLPPEVLKLPQQAFPPARALYLAREIVLYFEGKWPEFDMECIDFQGLTEAQIQVLRTVAAIPYGEVLSYGEVGARSGRPKAGRFVGSVMAANPFPILIPCHRVVRANGALGGFGGGLNLKERMLLLENPNFLAKKSAAC